MSKKSNKPEFIPADPDSPDENVRLPRQHRLAVDRVDDLYAGRQPRPVEVNAASAKSGSAFKFPYTDAQIDAARARLEAQVDRSNPDGTIAVEIFREGERVVKARRRVAQKPRKTSAAAIQRQRVLIQAVMELPPGLRPLLTGQRTIEWLVKAIKEKLGLQVSEDTVRHDIRLLRSFLRVVQDGKIPLPGQPRRTQEVEERTRLEQEGGRRTAARLAANPDLLSALSDPATIFEK
jgi:hypothetical protein